MDKIDIEINITKAKSNNKHLFYFYNLILFPSRASLCNAYNFLDIVIF